MKDPSLPAFYFFTQTYTADLLTQACMQMFGYNFGDAKFRFAILDLASKNCQSPQKLIQDEVCGQDSQKENHLIEDTSLDALICKIWLILKHDGFFIFSAELKAVLIL